MTTNGRYKQLTLFGGEADIEIAGIRREVEYVGTRNALVYFHLDWDGIASAAIMKKLFPGVTCDWVSYEYWEKVRPDGKYYLFLDYEPHKPELERLGNAEKIIVIGHHYRNDVKGKNVAYFRRLNEPVTWTMYLVAKYIGKERQVAEIAIVGLLGYGMEKYLTEMKKEGLEELIEKWEGKRNILNDYLWLISSDPDECNRIVDALVSGNFGKMDLDFFIRVNEIKEFVNSELKYQPVRIHGKEVGGIFYVDGIKHTKGIVGYLKNEYKDYNFILVVADLGHGWKLSFRANTDGVGGVSWNKLWQGIMKEFELENYGGWQSGRSWGAFIEKDEIKTIDDVLEEFQAKLENPKRKRRH